MTYKFTKHIEEPRTTNSYSFVSITKGQYLGVAMPLARLFKEDGWNAVYIEYDKQKKVIRLIRTRSVRGFQIGWQHIKADLRETGLPKGRYRVFKQTQDSYYLKYEPHD